ncbi:RIB43A-like with coiled-coils protein 2 [Antechinus flavipes]|uniref:RIB43A-like with coiled-coils protein 2 n=1 Tax=Antechinus flavipes TaxID=38775 RepID=UPI0022366723|nr:RIB43A-like with coiled-coils protein 2 [Antechinus flavipes]
MMSMRASNVVQPQDYKEAAALERARHAELQLQRRLLNARERLIGGDYSAWAAQVCDRKMQEAAERRKQTMIGAEMKHHDSIASILEERQRRDRRNLEKTLCEFRQNFQKPEDRQDFDLSDPLALKKDTPARVSDQDVANPVSGMQKFAGEDQNAQERKKAQQLMNRTWVLEQQRVWDDALAEHKLAEDVFHKSMLEFDQSAVDLQKLELAVKRTACKAVKDFNKNQVLEEVERKRLDHKKEEEDNMVEITNNLQSRFLSEDQLYKTRPCKEAITEWKSMKKEQLEEILQVQKQQIQDKQKVQEEERQRDFDWDQRRIQEARATLLFERQQQRINRELRRAIDNENMNLAKEHKDMEDYLNKQLYINRLTSQFFDQFNSSSK